MNHRATETWPAMNLKSSKHMVLFLLLNVSVPDQSDNICSSLLESDSKGGKREKEKEIPGKDNARATGDEDMKESWQWDVPGVSSPQFTSTSIMYNTELVISLGLNYLYTGYERANTTGPTSLSQHRGRS